MSGKHHRRSIRLKGYNYAQAGAYFITICTQGRAHLFGDIVDGGMRLNDAGHMIERWYAELANKFSDIQCGEYIVMPNHFHGIIINVGADRCVCPDGAGACPDGTGGDIAKGAHVGAPLQGAFQQNTTVPSVVQWFKTMTTNAYIRGVKQSGWLRFDKKLWQRNYWEHIIRNDNEHQRIAQYIRNNPTQWQQDPLNPRRGEPRCSPSPIGSPTNQIKEPEPEYANEVWMV